MNIKNFLSITNKYDFRNWLLENSEQQTECWVLSKKGKPSSNNTFYYIDAVEEALCFGWIDSIHKTIEGIGHVQRFSPRRKNSYWTELNKERVRRLSKIGLMTDFGIKCLPDMDIYSFKIIAPLEKDMRTISKVWENYLKFHPLYQRVRVDAIQRQYYNTVIYERMKKNFFNHTIKGEMYGQWNDYGRLINY